MKNYLLLIILFFVIYNAKCFSQEKTFQYYYNIDLNTVSEDQLEVTLTVNTPPESAIFQFPAIVPGTYKVYDFGRFVSELTAYNSKEELLEVEKLNDNQYKINDISDLDKIHYYVDDTWDTPMPNKVFEPAGTNIENDDVFVINNHGFFGYFDGMENFPFHIEVKKPSHLYGGSALTRSKGDSITDHFDVVNYHRLVDNPIIYTEADTVTLNVGTTKVFVSIYSPNKKLNADLVGQKLIDVLEAQKVFLKNQLPTDHYSFLIYLTDKPGISGAMGALEHWNCSFYFLPEESPAVILPVIQEIAAHEFFHIITPLSIHSEEIAHFDYMEPKMSKHLWLYEGVTEYFAGLALVQANLIDEETYLDALRGKIITAKSTYMDDLAFTELSKKCLEEYGNQYGNVYQKGALIGLALDLILIENSDGKYNLRDLMLELSQTYGSSRPFKDDQLFHAIDSITGVPEVKEFLEKYVDSPNPFPYTATLQKVGVTYLPEEVKTFATFGNIGISVNDDDEIFVEDIIDMDDFGKQIGYQVGDVLLKMNNTPITIENIGDLMNNYINHPEKFPKLKLQVRRDGKTIQLKSKTLILEEKEYDVFYKDENPTKEQQLLYRQWLQKII
ncbi:M61 family metallopeptidase [Flammeovirga aprica]|uniref:Peptidase M61 n=1 Tax=Flammeovirga aprica JL-4 TaxID=694437 RepID=A0A7X9RZV8_9BACT|nr:peptidase M61 [Flammeovirga aprica]NME71793.1 peptidase M61 [Flammeovirga aprica JL-4]